jgi:hypothetical protein
MIDTYDWTTHDGYQRAIAELESQQTRLTERERQLDLLEARLLGVQESLIAILHPQPTTTNHQ